MAKPEDIWIPMQPLFKIHIWLTFATLFLPFKYIGKMFMIIALIANFIVIVYQAVVIQRSCLSFNAWEKTEARHCY
jgi:hypothetical protein